MSSVYARLPGAPAAASVGDEQLLGAPRIDPFQARGGLEEIVLSEHFRDLQAIDGGEPHAPLRETAARDGLSNDLSHSIMSRVPPNGRVDCIDGGCVALQNLKKAAFDEKEHAGDCMSDV